MLNLPGIHHVTAITADAQANLDFYSGVLGLRLVKVTVNFDDPGSYHLYYGDATGRPGSAMTFFAWPGAARGRVGPPQVIAIAFAVPRGSLGFWNERLARHGVAQIALMNRLGEEALSLLDPDGIRLDIVASAANPARISTHPQIPLAHSIVGFHSVTIAEEGYEETARLLTDVMHLRADGSEHNRFRYRAACADGYAAVVDLLCVPDAPRGSMGAGVVHHVAFRAPDDAQHAGWHRRLVELGYNVSPIMDRKYFRSIYFREPGGVLFEIATDGPGFAVDESIDQLGSSLVLPPWYEPRRAEIENALPPLRLPNGRVVGRS
ncbi:ring-cleaving dioxygenase [Fontivita pretiosa]|uniref:ring-cleaving dioxygenase n=1 Tax=Fontivita pretiosa TaxID=2989684 RepID=UPI003D16769C